MRPLTLLALLFFLTACGSSNGSDGPQLSDAARCDYGDRGVSVKATSSAVTVHGNPAAGIEQQVNVTSAVECVVEALGGPSNSITDEVTGTSAINGTQHTSWPGFSASYSYNTSVGLTFVVTPA